MQKLNMVDADTLLYQPLDKPRFVVDGLIPTGLILFCGSQKIGKSWLMLKLCLCVSAGLPFWEMETRAGDVLYLCLEDTFFPHTGQAFPIDGRGGQPPALRCGELQAYGRADRAVGGLSEGVPRQQAHCDRHLAESTHRLKGQCLCQ